MTEKNPHPLVFRRADFVTLVFSESICFIWDVESRSVSILLSSVSTRVSKAVRWSSTTVTLFSKAVILSSKLSME